jgi:hypothetical protein
LHGCKFNGSIDFAMTQHALKLTARRLYKVGCRCANPPVPGLSDAVHTILTSGSPELLKIFTFYEAHALHDIETGDIATACYQTVYPVTAGALVELYAYCLAGYYQCVARVNDKRWVAGITPFPVVNSI